jgi:hypothetical protein
LGLSSLAKRTVDADDPPVDGLMDGLMTITNAYGRLIVAAIIVGLATGAVWWVRRSANNDAEYRSFRATATHRSRLPAIGVGLLVIAAALWLVSR